MKVSSIVLALFLGASSAAKIEHRHHHHPSDKSLVNTKSNDDTPNEGSDDSNVGVEDDNVSIGSLAKEKKTMEVDSEQNDAKEKRKEQIRNEINEREGSSKNQELFKNINEKLTDKSFIEQAIESSAKGDKLPSTITNQDRPEDLERHADDLYHAPDQSQHDRSTDTISGFHKVWEDDYDEGKHNTAKTNSPIK